MDWRYRGYSSLNIYLSPKFGVNPLDGFRENDVYARTTDTHVMTVAQLCSSHVAQSRGKNNATAENGNKT